MKIRQWLWGVGMMCWIAVGPVQACDNPTGTATRNATHNVGLYELNPYTQLWILVDSRFEPGTMSPLPGDFVEYFSGPGGGGGGGGGGGELQSDRKGADQTIQDCNDMPELETVTAIGHSIPGSGNMMVRRISRSGGGGFVRMTGRITVPTNLPTPQACSDGPTEQLMREEYASAYVSQQVGSWSCALNSGAGEIRDVPFSGASSPGRYRWARSEDNRCGAGLFMEEVSPPVCQ